MTASACPTQARTVIIGGGIVGTSIAYHLVGLGHRDVVLLEQGRLSGGTTWHAAGLVGQLRQQASLTRMIRYSTGLYERLEAETGLATGWKRCGSLTVARTPERMTVLARNVASARAQGVEIEMLDAAEAGRRWAPMRHDDLLGAVWLPGDGKANPSDVTAALARGARLGGARILERTGVRAIETAGGRVRAVVTDQGRIACETLVIAAGQWSRQVGALCGVAVPLHAAEHMYIVTDAIPGVTPDLPVMRDPDGYIYFKEEVGGLVMGGFEPQAKPWGMDGIPENFEFQLLPDDWDQFEILMENAIRRVPALETAQVKLFLNGPESFTPDNNCLLGPAPDCAGVYVAAGFNSAGIALGGGAGRALAEWLVAGEPTDDLWAVDIRRFARFNANPTWLHDRVKETLGLHYAMPWPNRELVSARPLRRSPLYDRLAARGAVFGSKMGWERANVFDAGLAEAGPAYTFGRGAWTEAVATEQRAVREGVGLADMTSLTKLLVQGRDAGAALQEICAADMAIAVGESRYTPILNARGGFESEVTVARLETDAYLVVTGSGQTTRDAHLLRGRIPAEACAVVTDVTSAYAVLALVGPRAAELLARVSRQDVAAIPQEGVREVDVGYATLRAVRRSFVGGDGFELYAPTEFGAGLYDTLVAAGAPFGLRDVGAYAVDALRIEMGHSAWGRDLGPDVTPFEAGLGHVLCFDKPAFAGREALLAARQAAPAHRLVALFADLPGDVMAWGGELILADGGPVGEVTSAALSAAHGGLVGLGRIATGGAAIDRAALDAGRFEIEIAGRRFPARLGLTPDDARADLRDRRDRRDDAA
ncbi:GcvT family protein [Methylobacterium planeticum]|uniref:FAD-dependent oxidoreductase n=1 Tax=Methylobacterium planeticum TaxID=2615211 RepID=A0A6N6MKR8_9HYPH|nr:FAD-dependent oxidoreductase [Methylobacterium planeticum]KAB1070286.1 FAD-dependent oxidoreductase [Methylobacterium planeticum]